MGVASMPIIKNQKGFTLVEQLLALGLGALLLVGVASSITAISRAQNLIRDYSHVQEALNFATSSLTRSARTANQVGIYEDNINNESGLLFNKYLSGGNESKTCIDKEADFSYIEIYSIKNNNLVCEVLKGEGDYDWEGNEVLVYGVSDFKFKCAKYDSSNKIEFLSCDSIVDDDDIIAVQVDLILDTNYFLEITENINHSFTIYLTSLHQNLINKRSSN